MIPKRDHACPQPTPQLREAAGGSSAGGGPLRMRTKPSNATLAGALLAGAGARDGLASVKRHWAPLRWLDERNGATRSYRPTLLATRDDGTRVFITVMTGHSLARDPDLRGMRGRIEAECVARNADFEVWTEREILEGRSGRRLFRPAHGAERREFLAWRASESFRLRPFPSLPELSLPWLAARAYGMDGLLPYGNGWLGRHGVTGIVTAILCDVDCDMRHRLLLPASALLPMVGGTSGEELRI